MANDRDKLMILATGRRYRMQSNSRPWFDLTSQEIARSTRTAMHLAGVSAFQAQAGANANADTIGLTTDQS